jgi:hypothetical protein
MPFWLLGKKRCDSTQSGEAGGGGGGGNNSGKGFSEGVQHIDEFFGYLDNV